jgi:hypothetical protein
VPTQKPAHPNQQNQRRGGGNKPALPRCAPAGNWDSSPAA